MRKHQANLDLPGHAPDASMTSVLHCCHGQNELINLCMAVQQQGKTSSNCPSGGAQKTMIHMIGVLGSRVASYLSQGAGCLQMKSSLLGNLCIVLPYLPAVTFVPVKQKGQAHHCQEQGMPVLSCPCNLVFTAALRQA
eukprot:1144571-Pelagomonas_calceolata.AAC.5